MLDLGSCDVYEKFMGRRRHIIADTFGLLLGIDAYMADVLDRNCGEMLLLQARRSCQSITKSRDLTGFVTVPKPRAAP